MHSLSSRVALITGASGNLGLATARALQRAGARTVLVDRSPDRLRTTYADLAEAKDHLLLGGVDLTDEASVTSMVSATRERFGRLDILVHTVGAWMGGQPSHLAPLEAWAQLHDANVRTTLLAARAVVPHLLAQRSGRIVTVGARAAFAADAGSAAYAAAKSGVLRLTEALAAELKGSGINVNCVIPSTIDTPQNRAAMPGVDASRWVSPEAIADVITFLASDAARAIHGAAIPVYGLS